MELNADMGESWYDRPHGNDAALMPYVDACNLACGFHGGDALTMLSTVRLALDHGVHIGAHPSFPDRKHFGRRQVRLSPERLHAIVLYQCGALRSMVRAEGGQLTHLKPHGALYHFANNHDWAADIIYRVARLLGIPRVYGPPVGQLRLLGADAGAEFIPEGFADRRYEADLSLRSRTLPGAVIESEEDAVRQVRDLVGGRVRAADGHYYPIHVETICIHGDHPGAAERARAVRQTISGGASHRPG